MKDLERLGIQLATVNLCSLLILGLITAAVFIGSIVVKIVLLVPIAVLVFSFVFLGVAWVTNDVELELPSRKEEKPNEMVSEEVD